LFYLPLDFKRFLLALAKSINLKDVHAVANAMKSLGTFRNRLTPMDALELSSLLPLTDSPPSSLPKEIEEKYKITLGQLTKFKNMPEVQAVLHLLYIMKALDGKEWETSLDTSQMLIQGLKNINRRTLDSINARVYYFFALACELGGELQKHRKELFEAYDLGCRRIDYLTQATVLNILLRSYVNENQYELARNFISKACFPENAPNSQLARYLYYHGRIKAVQLEYSEAETKLAQALRKVPQKKAKWFRLEVTKLLTIVKLLMGAIPERSIFLQPDLKNELYPYLLITQSVRTGNLQLFAEIVNKYSRWFINDQNYNLIQR